ncbi:MAG: DUF2961 domain-containing protein [Cytophagales bacterium]|nr:DUF2961 domain-containing protein [Cytophagales bacterium]
MNFSKCKKDFVVVSSFYISILLIVSAPKFINAQIATGSLLDEMIDRSSLTKYPIPSYSCGQFGSYDRNTDKVDGEGWFANWDRSYWLRIEYNKGRREFVMMDSQGPGAVVRFWVTVAAYGGNGTLRIYIDGAEEPIIEGEIFKLLSGGALVAEPLATSVSKASNYLQRGHNLYFPVPYAQHCKITYESAALTEEPGAKSGEALYYNINFRTYEEGTNVKSFTKNDLTELADKIQNTNTILNNPNEEISNIDELAIDGGIAPGEKIEKTIKGKKAVHRIQLKIRADNLAQALRSTVLEIVFDGIQTVWCPVGDFFGIGYKYSPFTTFYCSALNDGTLISNWVMPFEDSCCINIHNYGEQEVRISEGRAYVRDYNWDERSMHFGAGWYEKYKMHTGDGPRPMNGNNENFFDLNYVTLNGKGVLVGTGVTLFNTVSNWWGEGDEKVYVDNETFPSHIGTGTEDYYGYAWCMPAKFSHPFIAQPDGSGNLSPGYTVNQRYRSLDAIPFEENLKFDMEIWHWAATDINYAPVSYWYMVPGGESNRKAAPEQVKTKVVLDKSDFYSKAPDENGRIEAEYLKLACSSGNIRTQSVAQFNWSNGSQVWWTNANVGSSSKLPFEIENETYCEVKLSLTKAADYGVFDIWLDGKKVVEDYDAYYALGVTNSVVSLGKYTLTKGEHQLKIVIKGANPSAIKKYMFGIDYIDVIPLTTGMNHINETSEIKVFPNPFSNEIFLSGLNGKVHEYKVYNIHGIVVEAGKLNGYFQININPQRFKRGVYFLNLDGQYHFKIVKNG